MELHQIGIVSESAQVSPSQLTRVAAALQKQATRDLGPVWTIQAAVSAFHSLDDVPLDYWPIIVRDDIHQTGALGIHLDKNGHPFALVQLTDNWSVTASHECLEMLCDPFGNRTKSGRSPKKNQGRVDFLVEVCDPSEAGEFGYAIDGIALSDFYTPHFFDPTTSSGARYSFTGAIKKPRQVLKGGYLSWHDPVSDHWWQEVFFGAKAEFRDLGVLTQMQDGGIRAAIYRQTPEAFTVRAPVAGHAKTARGLLQAATTAGSAKATLLRQQIDALLKGE